GGISGPGVLTKAGPGTLVFLGGNSYTGATTVAAGILNVQSAGALGMPTAGVSVSSGASLQLQTITSGTISVGGGKTLSLAGTGFGNSAIQTGALGQGALVNLAGQNAWSGNIALSG